MSLFSPGERGKKSHQGKKEEEKGDSSGEEEDETPQKTPSLLAKVFSLRRQKQSK